MKSETVSLVRRWTVSVLIVVLALLDPVGISVFAQNGGTIPVPRSPKLPPPGVFQQPVTAADPIVDAVTADLIATIKDAQQHGRRGEHLRRQAAGLRVMAAHLKQMDAQVIAWANAQDPIAFQFEPMDLAALRTLATRVGQTGTNPIALAALANITPGQRLAFLTALRKLGLSGLLTEAATFLEQASVSMPTARMMNDHGGILRFIIGQTFCGNVGGFGTSMGLLGSMFGVIPGGLALSLYFGAIGAAAGIWNYYDCPGQSWFGYGEPPF